MRSRLAANSLPQQGNPQATRLRTAAPSTKPEQPRPSHAGCAATLRPRCKRCARCAKDCGRVRSASCGDRAARSRHRRRSKRQRVGGRPVRERPPTVTGALRPRGLTPLLPLAARSRVRAPSGAEVRSWRARCTDAGVGSRKRRGPVARRSHRRRRLALPFAAPCPLPLDRNGAPRGGYVDPTAPWRRRRAWPLVARPQETGGRTRGRVRTVRALRPSHRGKNRTRLGARGDRTFFLGHPGPELRRPLSPDMCIIVQHLDLNSLRYAA